VTPMEGPNAEVARTFLELVAALPVGTEAALTIVFGRSDFALQRVVLSGALPDRLRSAVIDYSRGLLDTRLIPYSAGRYLSPGESSFRSTEDLPPAVDLNGLLSNQLDLPIFTPATMSQGHAPSFYVVSLRDRGQQERIHALRQLDAGYRLKRGRFIPPLIPLGDGSYGELEEEPLLLKEGFDAVFNSELTVVSNQHNLDRMLGIVEAARATAKESLQQVTNTLRIVNYDEFEAAVLRDGNMLVRLESVRELSEEREYRDCMTMERIVEFAKANPQANIELQGAPGEETLVFRSHPQHRWKLLQLLNDGFVRSMITQIKYETNSKSRM
jgi:hypothetical protein